jgi:thiamine pyrophosphate-dependent acetolactate synthase large subunit-like protein
MLKSIQRYGLYYRDRLENICWVLMPSRNRYYGISTPVTKWNYQRRPPKFRKSWQGILFARSGRPGPVLVDITKNAQFDELSLYKMHSN